MDVVRSRDEARLSAALNAANWSADVEDEGWHWVATGAPSFSALGEYITGTMTAISRRWALTLSSFYERRRERQEIQVELLALQLQENERNRSVDKMRRDLLAEHMALQNEGRWLEAVVREIGSLDAHIRQLQEQRANKVYTYCPNHEPYASCTHTDLKAQYDRELQDLENQISAERARRIALAADYSRRRGQYPELQARYNRNYQEWQRAATELGMLRRRVIEKRTARQRTESAMAAARASSDKQLREIQRLVTGWPAS